MSSETIQGTRQAGKAYSGKVNLRMPKSLHRDLARRAEEEGGSQQYVVNHTDEVPCRLLDRIPEASVGRTRGTLLSTATTSKP